MKRNTVLILIFCLFLNSCITTFFSLTAKKEVCRTQPIVGFVGDAALVIAYSGTSKVAAASYLGLSGLALLFWTSVCAVYALGFSSPEEKLERAKVVSDCNLRRE